MLLVANIAAPVLAGTPRHGRQGGHHTSQHAQVVRVAGKHHGGKRRTVTRTFANGASIAIPADTENEFGPADPYPSSISVAGFKQGKITDLNLTLHGFSHEFPGDVGVMLVVPDGRNALVMEDVGTDAAVDELTITLDDEAANLLPVETALTSGSFRPLDGNEPGVEGGNLDDFPAPGPSPNGVSALSTFDGANPNGQWQLFVIDDSGGDVGSLSDGWSLQITAQVKTKNHKH
jgi:subtilisin-like proprotein convertase family protein